MSESHQITFSSTALFVLRAYCWERVGSETQKYIFLQGSLRHIDSEFDRRNICVYSCCSCSVGRLQTASLLYTSQKLTLLSNGTHPGCKWYIYFSIALFKSTDHSTLVTHIHTLGIQTNDRPNHSAHLSLHSALTRDSCSLTSFCKSTFTRLSIVPRANTQEWSESDLQPFFLWRLGLFLQQWKFKSLLDDIMPCSPQSQNPSDIKKRNKLK